MNKSIVNHTLEPLYDRNSRILILGTFPSPKSREVGFYYSHPQNRFWKVFATIFKEPIPSTIEEKKSMMLKHHIALWDVLASCQIKGASDSSITSEVPNDLSIVLENAPIETIYTTGKKAYNLYQKYCYSYTKREADSLPSTSPANCAMNLEMLVEKYNKIIKDK